jgi:hypothetical protein
MANDHRNRVILACDDPHGYQRNCTCCNYDRYLYTEPMFVEKQQIPHHKETNNVPALVETPIIPHHKETNIEPVFVEKQQFSNPCWNFFINILYCFKHK